MDAAVGHARAVDAVFLLEVGVVPGLDVVDDRLPAVSRGRKGEREGKTSSGRQLTGPELLPPEQGEEPGEHPHAPLVVVDKVAKAGRVDDGEPKPDAVLLNVGARALDGDGAGELGPGLGVHLGRPDRRREERVDQGRLAEAGLAWRGGGEVGSVVGDGGGERRRRRLGRCLLEMRAGVATREGRTDDHGREREALTDAASRRRQVERGLGEGGRQGGMAGARGEEARGARWARGDAQRRAEGGGERWKTARGGEDRDARRRRGATGVVEGRRRVGRRASEGGTVSGEGVRAQQGWAGARRKGEEGKAALRSAVVAPS